MTIREVSRISSDDLIRIMVVGFGGLFVPLFFLGGLLSLLDIIPFSFEETEYSGILGLIIAWAMGLFFTLIWSLMIWIFLIIGLRLTRALLNLIEFFR